MRVKMMVVSLVLILGVFLIGGCAQPATDSAAPAAYKAITMVDSSMGSSTQAMMIAMTRILNKYYPEIAWGVRTGAAQDNIARLTEGTITLTFSGPVAYAAIYGEGKESQSRLRAIAMNTRDNNIPIAVKDAPFENARDLPKGASFIGGTPGSSTVVGTALWMKAFGWTKSDLNYRELGKSESAEAWRNGSITAMICSGGLPMPFLTELAATKQGYKVLKATEADFKPIMAEAKVKGYFVKELQLTQGAPQHFTYNVWGLEAPTFISVRDDFPAEIAYKMAKVFDEHYDEVVAGNALCSSMKPDVLTQFAGGAFPLHPGVEKYFKEKGYVK